MICLYYLFVRALKLFSKLNRTNKMDKRDGALVFVKVNEVLGVYTLPKNNDSINPPDDTD